MGYALGWICLGWICSAVFVNALMSVFISDTLKEILKELKKK